MDIIKYYNGNRHKYKKYLLSKTDSRMFDHVDIERILDEVLVSIMKAPQAKDGFKSTEHLSKYVWKALIKKRRIEYFIRVKKMLNETNMTEEQRVSNFQLARDIINQSREFGGLYYKQKKREEEPYIFYRDKNVV